MNKLKIVVAGAAGRMGRMLVEAVLASDDCELHAALESAASPAIGRDAGEFLGRATGVPVASGADVAISGADLLIDFTRPEATLSHLEACRRHRVNAVIGTTGLDSAGKQMIASAAADVAVVFAPNMSVGVNLTFKLIEVAARALGKGYDVEIVEAHHRNKVDAPSGTALRMGEVAAQALQAREAVLKFLYERHLYVDAA